MLGLRRHFLRHPPLLKRRVARLGHCPAMSKAIFRTNLFALFCLCKVALPHLPQGGTIINTSSIQGYQLSPGLLDYASTRGAITALTHALAKQIGGKEVRVNAVAPAPVWAPR